MAANLGATLFASTGILLALATVTTALRCVARLYVVRAFGLDDWLMIITLALFAHYSAWVFYGRSRDKGRPDNEIPLSDVVPALRAFWLAELSYFLECGFLKMSIGTFLLRFADTKLQRWSIYTALAIIFFTTMTAFIVAVFQCKPVSRFWHPERPGSCLSKEAILAIGYTHGSIIGISDFFFAILPMFVVWSLQMSRRMKISVTILMSFGAIAGITTIARFPYISAIVEHKDFFLNTARLATLSSVEPGLGIILGSIVATRPLFRVVIEKSRSWATARSQTHEREHSVTRRYDTQYPPQSGPSQFIRLESIEVAGKEFAPVMVKGGRGLNGHGK